MTSPSDPPPFEIRTGSRLHLGLLDTREPFGGVGAMLDRPCTRLRVRPASRFEARGAAPDRVAAVVQRYAAHFQMDELPRCCIEVLERPLAHAGLGSGTQLAMAVAEAVCHFAGRTLPRQELAVGIAGRGLRSAVGAHGYFDGGLIYEAAANAADGQTVGLNPIQCRVEMPSEWRVLLVQTALPAPQVAGETEQAHFARLDSATAAERLALIDELENELLPAAAAGDFRRWSDAVYRYNRCAGNLFAAVQGGPYNGPAIEACVADLRRQGICGVGQSSWGPTVFAFCESEQQAVEIQGRLADPSHAIIARLINHGRRLGSKNEQTPP